MKSLTETLQELKASSPAASKIIDSHFNGFLALAADEGKAEPQEKPEELQQLVHTLLDTVAYQAGELERISNNLPPVSETLYEDMETFAESLKAAYVSDLVLFYNRNVLLPLKEETRLAVCKVLVAYAKDKKKQPADLWTSVIAANGILEI